MNPFSVFDLHPTMDLDLVELERRYIRLSRECHPDYHQQSAVHERLQTLQRSADLNAAYKILANPWERARAMLELHEPGIMERTKTLDPTFLMEAMEHAEEVAAAGPEHVPQLRERISSGVNNHLQAIAERIDAGEWDKAATQLHQARYFRKSLTDLEDKHGD